MKFEEAQRYLMERRRLGVKLGLENMRRAMDLLGHPEEGFPAVLVAGSKGKGSLCAFLEAIMIAAGFRTGMYTSPHLTSVRERIRIGGRAIEKGVFGNLMERLRRRLGSHAGRMTYFELLTAMAIVHFRDSNVDIGILEVGLGGRFDATNIVPAAVTVVTEIEKEHTALLGDSLREIAREKGGIIRKGAVFFSGVTSPSARRVLAARARACGVRPRWLDRLASWEITGHSLRGLRMDLRLDGEHFRGLRLATLGRHQARNAALALLTAVELRGLGYRIPKKDMRRGLSRVRWPGRCDYRRGHPAFFLDGAHTPSSARALAETLEELFPRRRRILLFGALREKRVERLAEILFPACKGVVLASVPEERSATAPEIMRRLSPSLRSLCRLSGDVGGGVRLAAQEAGRDGLVVVTGSLFLVGAVLEIHPWGPEP